MKCPYCESELSGGLLPARCPSCGHALGETARTELSPRASADRAAASRAGVEGLSGMGRGRFRSGNTVKRVVRVIVGLAIAAAFCVIVYIVAYQAELIGGRTIPDVSGWRVERAASELESRGFVVATAEVSSTAQVEGMVVGTDPGAGTRAPTGDTITVMVSTGASEDSASSEQ